MSAAVETHPASGRTRLAIGWVMSGLLIAFMIFDTAIKLLDLQVVVDTMNQLGIPPSLDRTIGAIELVCLALYAIPRTSVLGAILFTAIFGGAITSHMRLGDPLFSHTLFGVYLGLLAWGGLWFRDERIRRSCRSATKTNPKGYTKCAI
jgi:hypothetical protein